MSEAKVTVKIPVGLHARPAAMFVQRCLRSRSRITIEFEGKKADGKSILQVLGLGVAFGRELLIRVEGDDEAETIDALVAQVTNDPME